jgi:hypothetical protein
MITDIKNFEIYNNRVVIIHALKEEAGEQVLYETRFECGEKEDDKYNFNELAALEYSKEAFAYLDNLDLEWTKLDT